MHETGWLERKGTKKKKSKVQLQKKGTLKIASAPLVD